MKAKSVSTRSVSRCLCWRASVAATILAASALVIAQPSFAGGYIAGDPQPFGASAGSSDYSAAPSFDEPSDGPVLAPAPLQPFVSESGSMYVPPPPDGLVQTPGTPPVNTARPNEMLPGSFGRPGVFPGTFR